MTLPRSQLISPAHTPYYHCIARCVRRSWLCGEDTYTGKNFDHRKPWLLERLALLTQVFAIRIAGFSIMSNHYHAILYIDQSLASSFSDEEVIDRWHQLYTGSPLAIRYRKGETLLPAERDLLKLTVARWRVRLASISWFMRGLNEFIARKANKEDGCKGRFWEGRFKSQALLDERALLACLAYVDLNPIRAGIAGNLETSDYTSVQARIEELKGNHSKEAPALMPFSESSLQKETQPAIPFALKDYLELVDWTGRCVRNDKKSINPTEPQILQTLGLNDAEWQHLALTLQKKAIRAMNGWDRVAKLREQQNRAKKVSK